MRADSSRTSPLGCSSLNSSRVRHRQAAADRALPHADPAAQAFGNVPVRRDELTPDPEPIYAASRRSVHRWPAGDLAGEGSPLPVLRRSLPPPHFCRAVRIRGLCSGAAGRWVAGRP
jgi:hypothetical protein